MYSIYGLRLESDRAIPGLAHVIDTGSPDTRVWLSTDPFCSVPDDRVEERHADRTVWRSPDAQWLRIQFSDGTRFTIRADGTDIWSTWSDPMTLEDAAVYLLGPVLGLVLRLKGFTCLHASAIAVGDRAIALLGPAGAGKSTTAAAFARLGHVVLSEDVVALTDCGCDFMVRPGYPTIRLWPASVQMLFQSPDALPPMTPTWHKRRLDLAEHGYGFQSKPLPLAAIYLLGDRLIDAVAPSISAVPGREALMALLGNTYASYAADARMQATDFDVLRRVVATIPVRRVNPHIDASYLSRLCEVIVQDFESVVR